MASFTESTSGVATTYVITDVEGNTITVVLTQHGTIPNTFALSYTGTPLPDAMATLGQLCLMWQSGLVP